MTYAQSNSLPPLLVANFKQNLRVQEVCAWLEHIADMRSLRPLKRAVELVVAPPATALWAARSEAARAGLKLAAQDIFYEHQGAFTGALGAGQMRDAGATYTLIGHSERHLYFQETWAKSQKRIVAAQQSGLAPIVCVGESTDVRQQQQTQAFLAQALASLVLPLPTEARQNLSFAYEPLWAIGTGVTAAPKDAQEGCVAIRAWLAEYAPETLSTCRIIYGGSVHAANAHSLLAETDIDGLLVGGASLNAESFFSIVDEGTQR